MFLRFGSQIEIEGTRVNGAFVFCLKGVFLGRYRGDTSYERFLSSRLLTTKRD